MRVTELESVAQARARARRRLPKPVFESIDSGAGAGSTRDYNEQAFRAVSFRPRAARKFAAYELATTVAKLRLAFPVLTAPCGGLRLVHPQGDLAVIRAAAAAGVGSVVSDNSGHSLQEARAAGSQPLWRQLYMSLGRERAHRTIDEANELDYDGLVVTVDTAMTPQIPRDRRSLAVFLPHAASRPRWLYGFVRDGMQLDPGGNFTAIRSGNIQSFTATWDDLEWIRDRWPHTLVIKGIVAGEDARRAVEVGADCIVVSNHGGKALDGAVATLPALPEVLTAVKGQCDVLLDGGVRSGADVVKAVASGAKAVLVGRPYIWGLAAAGEPGVERVLRILRREIERTLIQLGCPSIEALDSTYLWRPEHQQRPV
jgi:isopentenyl diphosphate isomerase/L-lactate dehydrogenase-like FMN-dependent dehydrogenase